MWGRGLNGNSSVYSALCRFSVTSPTTHNQIGPFWCLFLSGWACVHSRTLWVFPTNSPMRLGVSPAAYSTPTGVFNQRFEALFPGTGTLGCCICHAPQFVLPVYLHANVGPPSPQSYASLGLPATALPWVLSTQLLVSAPPTSLDECFFFNSLVVRLPYSSIFCQFCLFLFLNLLLSFFWLCEEAQCIYLYLHLGWKS